MTRKVLRGLRAVALTGTLVLASGAAFAEDPIKLGCWRTSPATSRPPPSARCMRSSSPPRRSTRRAASLGRQIELVHLDTQSDNTRYQEFIRRVLQRDKVDVVFAGFSSASREACRPIVDQFDGFAFYNNQYEGGVCDAHMIVTGAVPEQQFSTLIPYMVETFGTKVYVIAADYNFGQLSAEWNRTILKQPAARWSARSSSRSG